MDDAVTVAIDGPVASGKTVVGRQAAGQAGLRFLDTGVMYRATTWIALQRGTDIQEKAALTELATAMTMRLHGERLLIDGKDVTEHLWEPEVERTVSLVSAVSGVRAALVRQQREMAQGGRIVMTGRDIGTVVLPDAALKVYLTASVGVRARRRYLELQRRGGEAEYAQVVSELQRRDTIDSERADSPLRPAVNALLIETDQLEVEDVVRKIVGLIRREQAND